MTEKGTSADGDSGGCHEEEGAVVVDCGYMGGKLFLAIASGGRGVMISDMDFLPTQPLFRDDSPEKEEKKEKEPKSKLEEKFLETRTILLFGEISQKSRARCARS